MSQQQTFQVVIIMGSKNDEMKVNDSDMRAILTEVGVSWSMSVISAHRHPKQLEQHCEQSVNAGALAFIGVAGMAAALPGAISSHVFGHAQVFGVGLTSSATSGMDALLSIVRMPSGRPVCAMGLDSAGLCNAALAACQTVAATNPAIAKSLQAYYQTYAIAAEINLQTSDSKE